MAVTPLDDEPTRTERVAQAVSSPRARRTAIFAALAALMALAPAPVDAIGSALLILAATDSAVRR